MSNEEFDEKVRHLEDALDEFDEKVRHLEDALMALVAGEPDPVVASNLLGQAALGASERIVAPTRTVAGDF